MRWKTKINQINQKIYGNILFLEDIVEFTGFFTEQKKWNNNCFH